MPDRTPEQIVALRALREQVKADRALLVERYPGCFCAKGQPKKPLKIGIQAEIIAAKLMPPKRLKRALGEYCSGTKFKRAMIVGVARIGLDGQPSGTVSEGDAQAARNEIRHREKQRIARQRQASGAGSPAEQIAA